jgi:hypothetical protein
VDSGNRDGDAAIWGGAFPAAKASSNLLKNVESAAFSLFAEPGLGVMVL